MSSERSVYRRVLRRETHSSRAGAAITVAICLVVLLLAAGVACVYLIAHLPAAAVVHGAFVELAGFRSAVRYPVLIGGVIASVLGIVVLLAGVLPGRKSRRRLASDRCAVVIDDDVLANTIADQVAGATGLETRQVRVTVERTRARIRIVPTSGAGIDTPTVLDTAERVSTTYGLTRKPRLTVSEKGVVG